MLFYEVLELNSFLLTNQGAYLVLYNSVRNSVIICEEPLFRTMYSFIK